jgi:hypothetical protein
MDKANKDHGDGYEKVFNVDYRSVAIAVDGGRVACLSVTSL